MDPTTLPPHDPAAPQPTAVTRAECRQALLWAALLMAATCVPYLICWYATPPGMAFPGVLFAADDHGVYFAWMRQAADGQFFFRNLFTAEPQQARYVHLYFWLLGTLAKLFHLSLPVAYHLGRVVSGVVTLVLVYRFAALFTADRFTRQTVFWTTALSGGLGWLHQAPSVSVSQPVDTWQPEALTFQSLYVNGLFAVSLALMLGVVVLLLLAQLHGRPRYAVGAGLCGLLLVNVHTYDVLTLAAVWSAYLAALLAVAPRTVPARLRDAAIAALVAAPAAAYQVHYYLTEPVFRARVEVPTLSQPLSLYLLGYGLVLPLAACGGFVLLRGARLGAAPHRLLPLVWIVAGFALLYLPVTFQRKLALGLHLPLGLLAGIGVAELARRAGTLLARSRAGGAGRARWLVAALLVGVTASSAVRFVARDLEMAVERNVTSTGIHPVWWPASDFAAMEWLSGHLPPDGVILCYPVNGIFMPAMTGRAVWVGHWGETPNYPDRFTQASRFYRGREPLPGLSRAAFLERERIAAVFYGPAEQSLSEEALRAGHPGFLPLPSSLALSSEAGATRVYRYVTP